MGTRAASDVGGKTETAALPEFFFPSLFRSLVESIKYYHNEKR